MRTRSSGSSAPAPIHSPRRRSRNGQYGSDSPYETQRPSSQLLPSRSASARNSLRGRVFPIPASPATTSTPPRPAPSASSASRPRPSSRERPTSRVSTPGKPRVRPAVATAATGHAATGSLLPLSSSVRASPHSNRPSTARCVASSTRTAPGSAADCSRAATFTVSPNAAYSTREPAPTSPTTTAPVAAPTRTPKPSAPQPRRTSRAYSSISATMRSAQRTARSASSSRVVGAPKKARTPSPARSLTCPARDSTSPTIRATASPTTSLTSSGSSRSASAVEPTTSAKTAVRTFRSSRTAVVMSRGWRTRAPGSSPSRGVRPERRLDRLVPRCRAGRLLEWLRVGMEPERGPRLVEHAASEERSRRRPQWPVTVRVLGAHLAAERDQLSEVRDGGDVLEGRDPRYSVRVEVVAEQERGVVVGRREQPRPAGGDEVALVDRLEPEGVASLAERREDGAAVALGIGQQAVGPQRALGGRADCHRLPEISDQSS